MGSKTAIPWCDRTFNPWRGCTHAATPECDHCYARTNVGVKLHGIGWGDDAVRVIKAESGWDEPYRWNRAAEKAGKRRRVFCGSLMDFFEKRADLWTPRARAARIMEQTSWLDWLILTKRPQHAWREWPWIKSDGTSDEQWPSNVALGTTVGHPDSLWRVEKLLKVPAAFRFLSIEPLLGELDLGLRSLQPTREYEFTQAARARIHQIIIGCESGARRRRCKQEWVESLIDQADAAGLLVFVKQMDINGKVSRNPAEWPESLRRREMPKCF